MACYIASNDNRIYVRRESQYGLVEAITGEHRIPAVKLSLRQTIETPDRRDKTGGRTWIGLPPGFRKRLSFGLTTYLAGWTETTAAPPYGPLFRAALGAGPWEFGGGEVATAVDDIQVGFTAPHGLAVGQGVQVGGEMRFVASIVDERTVHLNAPLSAAPEPGTRASRTVTYAPANDLDSVSIFDYWSPATAVQRILAGAAVDRLEFAINGDFHQFRFRGTGSELIDNLNFAEGMGGLAGFPEEPDTQGANFALVPGNLGQAWFGTEPNQFHTVLAAEIFLDNDLDLRRREFGQAAPACIVAGMRTVGVNLRLASNISEPMRELYQAASQRSPISVMLQLGVQEGQLCGIYLPAVVPELPEFDDDDTRLVWEFRNCRAQGTVSDEIMVAFG